MRAAFDTPFDCWMKANDVRPLHLARKAEVSRPTILRLRKGSLGSARTRAKIAAACSAIKRRPVSQAEIFFGVSTSAQRFSNRTRAKN